jgi:hypothetical protein
MITASPATDDTGAPAPASERGASPTAFLARVPLRTLFDIPAEVIDRAKAMAYQCHQADRRQETQSLCRGLLAVDHRCWWTHALYAASLHSDGRLGEALTIVDRGLRYNPGQLTLVEQRRQLLRQLPPEPPAQTTTLSEAA